MAVRKFKNETQNPLFMSVRENGRKGREAHAENLAMGESIQSTMTDIFSTQ